MSIRVLSAQELCDEPHEMAVHSSECLWAGPIFSLHEDRLSLGADQPEIERQYIRHPGAVTVVPLRVVEGRNQVLLIKQYRHPVRAYLWEYPAGLLDIQGEDYLAAAKRELAEETDLTADRWDVLVDYFATPGGHNESIRIYLARDLSPLPATADSFERSEEEALFEWAWVDLEDVAQAVLSGKLHNPALITGTLVTYFAAKNEWSTLRSPDSAWMR